MGVLNSPGQWIGQVISNWFRPKQIGGVFFYPIVGDIDVFKELEYLHAFTAIPELNSIINWKARAFSSGTLRAFKNNKDAIGEEIFNDPVIALLKKPNWFQAEKEFLRQTKLFHEIFGNEYLYSFFGIGSSPIKSKAFYSIPPNLMEVDYSQQSPFFLETEMPKGKVKYIYKMGSNPDYEIPIEQLIHLNDNRVNITDQTRDQMLKGESKLKSLAPVINNLKMAYETRGVILKKRGALGILSNASTDVAGQVPLDLNEKQELQKQYETYGGLDGQQQLIITNANLKWQQMSVSPDKLGLFQETREDFFRMCDAYGVKQELFASDKGTTYENQKEAKKDAYDNTIIPEANEWISAIQNFFYPNRDVILVFDFSHLTIYQEDLEMNANALGTLVKGLSQAYADKAITIEEYQIELNKIGLAVGNKPT